MFYYLSKTSIYMRGSRNFSQGVPRFRRTFFFCFFFMGGGWRGVVIVFYRGEREGVRTNILCGPLSAHQ